MTRYRALQIGMIGRGNYALSMRLHKRQKSRFQCDGKCTKVAIARLDPTEKFQPASRGTGDLHADGDVLAATSDQMRAEMGMKLSTAPPTFPATCFRRCLAT